MFWIYLSRSFLNEVYDKVSYLQKNKNDITWKPLARTKWIFLSKLDLSEVINWQLTPN